jgi:hypothetical protein
MKLNIRPRLRQQLRIRQLTIVAIATSLTAAAMLIGINLFQSKPSEARSAEVALVKFEAKPKGDIVQLQWATNSEEQVHLYSVERAGSDLGFELLGSAEPEMGSHRATRFYVINDLDPRDGLNYYNLMVESVDGETAPLASTVFVYYNPPVADIAAFRLAKVVNFNAVRNQDAIDLNWATSEENGAKKFELLKSTDDSLYTRLGVMNAQGYSRNSRIYTYTDFDPAAGLNYYTLKVYDDSGNSFYSDAVALLFQ